MTINELYQAIKDEDELPSGAGQAFRDLINEQYSGTLGIRELALVRNWLNVYLEMPSPQRNDFVDKLAELNNE